MCLFDVMHVASLGRALTSVGNVGQHLEQQSPVRLPRSLVEGPSQALGRREVEADGLGGECDGGVGGSM
jgi:hypothetical protein